MVVVCAVQSDKELKQIRNLRHRIFVEQQKVPANIEFDKYDETAYHLCIKDEEQIIGTARMRFFPDQQAMKLERLCLEPAARGKHYMDTVIPQIIDIAKALNIHQIIFLCEKTLISYWQKKGFFLLSGYQPIDTDSRQLYVMGTDIVRNKPAHVVLTKAELLGTTAPEKQIIPLQNDSFLNHLTLQNVANA